jgi:RND family efflux transporter MFP subunit
LGDRVRQGQVIVYLEDKEYENGIAMESKELNFDISEMEFQKQESLYEKGGVTLREFRNSEVSYINARNELERAQIQLGKMKVVAPFDGVIVDLPYYTPGTKVNTGQSMVKLMAYSNMYMEINLPEKHMKDLKTGQNVHITSYVYPDDTLTGKVTEISPAISTETRTFKCKLQVQNPELKLRPGMFVKADIVTQRKSDIIIIPKEYILTDARGKRVFIVQQSTARQRRITTGLENQYEVEVLTGLETNQRLVIQGFETLRDRAKIKVIQ